MIYNDFSLRIKNFIKLLRGYKMRKRGFTLAEVLITLGIIGVVAAMTIPTLMLNIKAAKLKSQFRKAHSTLLQAYRLMLADEVSTDPRDYTDSITFYRTYIRYFKGATDCGAAVNSSTVKSVLPCYNTSDRKGYKTLNTKVKAYEGRFDDGQIALPDGSLILIENYGQRLWVSVDINGYNNKPNIWGVDLFTFEVLDSGLTAMGSRESTYNDTDKYCNKNKTDESNGIACAKKAIDDPDYFKKVVKDLKL